MGLIVHRIRQFTRQQPTILFALAVLALLVRAGVPAGWMPSFAGGAVAISVCSGEGRATMWLDKSGQIHKSDPAQSDLGESECAFAAGAGAVDVALATAPRPAALVDATRVLVTSSATPGRGLAAPPPPQTGPPLLI